MIKTLNKWMLCNLFWIVPIYGFVMISGIAFVMFQGNESLNNDADIKAGTELLRTTIEADTTLIPKIDSLRATIEKMR